MRLVVYSNCVGSRICRVIQTYLPSLYRLFSQRHDILNYELIRKKGSLPVDRLSQCDVFLYSPLRNVHGIYGTDEPHAPGSIMTLLPPHCIKIAFPTLFLDGLWAIWEEQPKIGGFHLVEPLIEAGFVEEDIVRMLAHDQIAFNPLQRFYQTWTYMRQREAAQCNVRVADFIARHLFTDRVMYTQNHPTELVMLEIGKQVAALLKVDISGDAYDLDTVRSTMLDKNSRMWYHPIVEDFWNWSWKLYSHPKPMRCMYVSWARGMFNGSTRAKRLPPVPELPRVGWQLGLRSMTDESLEMHREAWRKDRGGNPPELCPGVIRIPRRLVHVGTQSSDRPVDFVFVGNPERTPWVRAFAAEHFTTASVFWDIRERPCPDVYAELRRARFALCPAKESRGLMWTIRTYQAIASGAVPVVKDWHHIYRTREEARIAYGYVLADDTRFDAVDVDALREANERVVREHHSLSKH